MGNCKSGTVCSRVLNEFRPAGSRGQSCHFERAQKIALVIVGHPLIDIRGPALAEFLYRDPVMRGDIQWASCSCGYRCRATVHVAGPGGC
jgi:hypothetical protein